MESVSEAHATVLGEETILDTPWLGVRRERVRFAGSPSECDFYVVRCPDYAQVVAITRDGRLALVEQYRHGSGIVSLELPAGGIDAGEAPHVAAGRELREEVGGESSRWTPLGGLLVNGSRMRSTAHGFLAEDVELVHATDHEETEAIEVRLVTLAEATRLVRTGGIVDIGSIAFLGLARLARPGLAWE